ncbi:MAG: hypothetical protein U0451_00225 [Candidatus Saccharimonadales bacterium]
MENERQIENPFGFGAGWFVIADDSEIRVLNPNRQLRVRFALDIDGEPLVSDRFTHGEPEFLGKVALLVFPETGITTSVT